MIDDFVKVGNVEPEVIKKYEGVLPKVLLDIWREYGYGSFLDGFVKVINPEMYMEAMREGYSSDRVIPMLATGFGDLLVCENEVLDVLLQFRYQEAELMEDAYGKTILKLCQSDPAFMEEKFEWSMYQNALDRYGSLAYDECFFYGLPIPFGGIKAKTIENLHKGKIRENILLNAALCGEIIFKKYKGERI